jgi:serine/threonine protein kinase
MMNEREIFARALDIADPEERGSFLLEACGTDSALCQHLRELLRSQEQLGSFLNEPPDLPSELLAQLSSSANAGARIGPYKLLQPIGEGGMGVVYMAEQDEPVRRKVALKIVKPGLDSRQVVARFEAERQALALMDHPNIARVLDAGAVGGALGECETKEETCPTVDVLDPADRERSLAGGLPGQEVRPYFVMELVYGVPITLFCDQRRLTPRQRLELFVPVCQAIHHAHQKGVIHRDVKPSNVLVSVDGDKAIPKVIDFGVAKATEQPLTQRTMFTHYGALVGTFEYMSPEQAEMNSQGVDTRSDIFSLGVLLYELLTGQTPIERQRLRAAPLDEAMRLIREEEPVRPSVLLSRTSGLFATAQSRRMEPTRLLKLYRGEIDWIVLKCLEKDRARRYDTASALARDVERYLQNEPVEACPPSAVYRARKFGRKHWAAIATAVGFASLLLAGASVSIWQAARATRAEREATQARDTAALYRELLLNDPKLRGLPTDHPDRATALIRLGAVLLQTDRPAIAEPVLAECLAIREKKLPGSWREYNACSMLGLAMLQQGKYAEAEPLLLRGQEGIARLEPEIPSNTFVPPRRALEWLVKLYKEWGKPDQADLWKRKLEARGAFQHW